MLDSIRGQPLPGAEAPTGATTPAPEPVPEHLAISLKAVLDRLPVGLKPFLTRPANPDEKFNVSTARVLPQLSTGAVRISFDEFRAAAPAGLFSAGGQGDALVDLPLPEVLRVAGPLLKRKPAQQAQPAAGSFFAGLGPPPAAKPAPPPAPAAPVLAPTVQPALDAPKSGTTFTTFQPAPSPREPAPTVAGTFAAAAPAPASGVVPVKLSVLTVGWPENIRKEAADLGDVSVEFPREELGNAMKSGKVSFTSGQLRGWMNPVVGPSGLDNTVLALPLRVLVQPFMANMKTAAKPAAGTVGDTSVTHFLNRVPSPEMIVPVAPAPAPVPADTKLGEALGKPEKAHWTPSEIIQAVIGLPPVFGAMLSLQEGQLAAAEMQATLPPELLAYALPKLFSATADQARQMKLGDPAMVSLVADGHHWAVFKLEKIFFTVMSRKGQLLPLPQLQTIATEIARQRK